MRKTSPIERHGVLPQMRMKPLGQFNRLGPVVPAGAPQFEPVDDSGVGDDGLATDRGIRRPLHRETALGDTQGLLAHSPDCAPFATGHRQAEAAHEGAEGGAQVDGTRPHALGLQMDQNQPSFRAVGHAYIPGAVPPVEDAGLHRQRKPPRLALPDGMILRRPAVGKAGLAKA